MQQVVVACREAVDQVEGEAAQEGGQCVLGHPPHLVGEEHGGEGTRDEPGVVRADDGVKQDLHRWTCYTAEPRHLPVYLFESHVEVRLGDGHLHPDQLGAGLHPPGRRQVGAEGAELVLVDLDPALVTRGQVYEGGRRGSEEDEVDADWVDQVEDVDHTVVLLDEEDKVAQYQQDQSDRAELRSVYKSACGRDWEHSDDERSDEEPQEAPAEQDQGEGDGGDVYQVKVHRLIVVAVWEPPDRPGDKLYVSKLQTA